MHPMRLALRSALLGFFFRLPLVRWYAAHRMFATVPHSRRLGMKAIKAGPGRVSARVDYREDLVGNPATGYLHAGVLTSLIDQTSGAAAFFSLDPPHFVATLDLRIDHLRAAAPGRALIAEAESYHVTSAIIFVRCIAHDGDRTNPVASSVSCFMRMHSMAERLPVRYALPRRGR